VLEYKLGILPMQGACGGSALPGSRWTLMTIEWPGSGDEQADSTARRPPGGRGLAWHYLPSDAPGSALRDGHDPERAETVGSR